MPRLGFGARVDGYLSGVVWIEAVGKAEDVLLFSQDSLLCTRLDEQLAQVGLTTQAFATPSALLHAMDQDLPHALLVDCALPYSPAVTIIEAVSERCIAAQIPIIGLYEHRPIASHFPLRMQVPRDPLPNDFPQHLLRLCQQHHRHREGGHVHPHTLTTLATAWRQGWSGLLHAADDTAPIALCDGGVIDPNDIPALEQVLTQTNVRFSRETVDGLGDWFSVGHLLYTAAQECGQEDFYRTHHRMTLCAEPCESRALALPLCTETQQLLQDRRTTALPLHRRLMALRIPGAAVETDLEVLWRLGLYRFQDAPSYPVTPNAVLALPSSSRVPPKAPVPAPSTERPSILRDQFMIKRLQRELNAMENTDDWSILGIHPTDDPHLVTLTGDNLKTQYLRLANETTHPTVQHLTNQITTRIDAAVASLDGLQSVYAAYGAPKDRNTPAEIAFRDGFAALQHQNLQQALQFFVAACDEHMQSARNLAYMAWSLHLIHGSSHQAEALEYLRLSDSLAPDVPQTQYFLAAVEADAGLLSEAEARIANLIRRGMASRDAHRLYRRIRQSAAP